MSRRRRTAAAVAVWLMSAAMIAVASGLGLSCGMLTGLIDRTEGQPEGPPPDMGTKIIEVLPDLANSGAYLLSTFVYTAVVVALVFPAARVAAVGVFVAFYDRVASWFRPKKGKSFVDPPINRDEKQ